MEEEQSYPHPNMRSWMRVSAGILLGAWGVGTAAAVIDITHSSASNTGNNNDVQQSQTPELTYTPLEGDDVTLVFEGSLVVTACGGALALRAHKDKSRETIGGQLSSQLDGSHEAMGPDQYTTKRYIKITDGIVESQFRRDT